MSDQPQDSLFERHAELCKVFANPKRLKILDLLKEGKHSVTEISTETEIPQPTVSQHLRKMRDQGVVTREDAGMKNYYEIADERIIEGMATMRAVMLDRLADDAAISDPPESP